MNDKAKLDLIHKIACDVMENPPASEAAEGYLCEALNVITLIAEYTGEEST